MTWEEMDKRLASYKPELAIIGVPNDSLESLATSIRDEVFSIDSLVLSKKFPAHYPDAGSVYGELAHILTFAERYFVEIYSDDSMNHAAVLSANYLYFVYTQDSYLKAIVSASPRHGPSKAVSKFLTTGEVWGFRNAFAHGQWRYVGSGRHPDIEYREDGKKEGRILILTPEKLQLWHWLSRTVLGLWAARIAYLRQPIQHPGHS